MCSLRRIMRPHTLRAVRAIDLLIANEVASLRKLALEVTLA